MKTARNNNRPGDKRRGSALLMVVGVLTILAMLGGTFLLISRVDSKTSKATAQVRQVEPVAMAVLARLQAMLAVGLACDPNKGPYAANTPGTTAAWYGYADYPSDRTHFPNDAFLSQTITQCTDPSKYPPILGAKSVVLAGATDGTSADADGDGQPDSDWVPLGIVGPRGEAYSAAVRIIDTSGLFNLNTACWVGAYPTPNPTQVPTYSLQVNMNLVDPNTLANPGATLDPTAGFVHGNTYIKNILKHRGPGYMDPNTFDATMYQATGVPQLLSTSTYYPYGVIYEPTLRWSGQGSTWAGLVYNDLKVPPAVSANTGYLTLWSSARSITRYPASNATDFNLSFAHRVTSNQLGYDFSQASIYQTLCTELASAVPLTDNAGAAVSDANGNAINPITDPNGALLYQQFQAAHIVANLCAYRNCTSTNATQVRAVKFAGADGNAHTVYGVGPQLFISEAYFYNLPKDSANQNDGFLYAVELVNRTAQPISTYTNPSAFYQFTCGGATVVLKDSNGNGYSIAPGKHLVFYIASGNYLPASGTPTPIGNPTGAGSSFGLPTGSVSLTSANGAVFDITKGPIVLQRCATIVGGPVVTYQADSLVPATLTDVPTSWPAAGTDPATINIAFDYRREDVTRYAIAMYQSKTGKGATALTDAPQNFGNDKGNSIVGCYADFVVHAPTAIPPVGGSLGDLATLYMTGPEDTRDLPNQLRAYANVESRGRLDCRLPVLRYTDSRITRYPDVPMPCLLPELIEMLNTDNTRQAPSTGSMAAQADRIYGRVNINTAPFEVLRQMPWPDTINGQNVRKDPARLTMLVNYIIAYREKQKVPGATRDYSTATGRESASLTLLRHNSNVNGFLTPGEIAIPLADFFDDQLMTPLSVSVGDSNYLTYRNMLYQPVANLVSVNSDTFFAYIAVKVKYPNGTTSTPWHYVAFLDRSNCRAPGDRPTVLLFTPVQ